MKEKLNEIFKKFIFLNKFENGEEGYFLPNYPIMFVEDLSDFSPNDTINNMSFSMGIFEGYIDFDKITGEAKEPNIVSEVCSYSEFNIFDNHGMKIGDLKIDEIIKKYS